jgi:hypothetical protein
MGNLAFWGIALPLCTAATLLEWEYCATDSAATMILDNGRTAIRHQPAG